MKSANAIAALITCLLCAIDCAIAAEPARSGLMSDIEFAKVGDVSLTLDAFVPEGAGPFATCILVHGGGFIRGDKQSYIKPIFEPLGKADFAWFTINYRLAPQHRWPACADDVETAIRWVALGNQCDLISIPDGVHGMGNWDKLKSDYREQMVAWLKTTLKAKADPTVSARLTELGGQLTQNDGIVTKVFFKDCSKLGDAEFKLIGQLTELKNLTLYGQCKGLTDETLPHLATLTKLEELGTDGMQVTDAGLAKLTALINVRSMSFFHPSFGMKGFDGSGFAALKALPKLERLTIAGTPFDDKGMAAIAEIKQLRDFRTWHTYQTQAGNESLTKLPELKSLWLGQRLRRYDGGSNAVSLDDSTLDVLTKLTTLESLTLDEARLSLTALRRLQELPRLKTLELRRIEISAEEIESLKTALPSVRIDWKPLTEDERTKLEGFLKS